MFNLEHAIAEWRLQMVDGGLKTPDALNELEIHLREDLEHRVHLGLSANEAFERAVQELGDIEQLTGEFAKTERARRRTVLYRGVRLALMLAPLGATFGYFALIPLALAASQKYSQWLGLSPSGWSPNGYGRFILKLIAGSVLTVEIPVTILTLVKMGIIEPRALLRSRKYVMVLNFVLSVLAAGPEIIPQFAMFVPLQLIYEMSVWVARRCEQSVGKREF